MAELSIRLPDIGEGITEVEIVGWSVKPGDLVHEDDVLASVMTDKATVEIPSLYSGRVMTLGCAAGERMAVGAELVRIESDATAQTVADTQGPKADGAPVRAASETSPARTALVEPKAAVAPALRSASPRPAQVSAPRPEGRSPLASPAVRARAREAGIDLRQVAGTGPAGRVTHADLDRVFATPTRSNTAVSTRREGTQVIKVTGLRRKIAERMTLANRIPHITVVEEVDVTALEDLRARMNESRSENPKLTMLPFLISALAKAILTHPEMNAHYDDEAGIVTRHAALHAGIATMTDGGLIVPVLRHAEALDPFAAAAEIARLAQVARNGKATRDELTGSTLTITSLGPLGAVATTPIINVPEVAILGVNKIAVRPAWDGRQFIARQMMNISASFDHRVIDGWNAASFVRLMKVLIETPALIFLPE